MSNWDYRVIGRRACVGCKGEKGWEMKDGFHPCGTCSGVGVETHEMWLEDALSDSEIIKDIRGAIEELLNA